MDGLQELKFQALEPAGKKLFALNISHGRAFYDMDSRGEKLNLYCLSNYERGPQGEFYGFANLRGEGGKDINALILNDFIKNYTAFVVRLESPAREPHTPPEKIGGRFHPKNFHLLSRHNYSCRLEGLDLVNELFFTPRLNAGCILIFSQENDLSQAVEEGKISDWLKQKNVEPVIFANLKEGKTSSGHCYKASAYNFKALLSLAENCEAVLFFPDDFEDEMLAVLSRKKLKDKLLKSINACKGDYPLRQSEKDEDIIYFLEES